MDIFHKAASHLIKVIDAKIQEKKKILLLLSGGSSINLYTHLSLRSKLLVTGQLDERFHPAQLSDINAEAIKSTGVLLNYVISQEGKVEKSVAEYNDILSRLWKRCDYKMAVLGIGEDCHTAGLIPGYEKEWNKDRLVIGYNLTQKFRQRITTTPKLLAQLDYGMVIAVGEKKKEAIKNALKKENLQNLNQFPAAIIQKIKKVELFTDMLS